MFYHFFALQYSGDSSSDESEHWSDEEDSGSGELESDQSEGWLIYLPYDKYVPSCDG